MHILIRAQIVAEATATAYKGSSSDLQQKIRRVVEVWRARNVFEAPILEAVEARVNGRFLMASVWRNPPTNFGPDIDKNRSTTKKQPLGGSIFKDHSAGSTPSELQPLVPLQVAVSKAAMTSNTSAATATAEYEKLHDSQASQPTPPVYAARLSQLLKTLANAESSVSEVIKSRRALIDGLEKLLATNRSELSKEEALSAELSNKKSQTDAKKRDVEDAIMRGLNDDKNSSAPHDSGDGEDAGRPQAEALTPPPVEALTPVGSPKAEPAQASHGPFNDEPEAPAPEGLSLPGISQRDNGMTFPDPSNLSPGGGNDFDLSGAGAAKRRKTSHSEEDYAQFAGGDLDADVAALLASHGKQ